MRAPLCRRPTLCITLMAAALCQIPGACAEALDPWTACAAAAAAASPAAGVPDGLLTAIGKVESGRTDPATGRVAPWPFSVNVEGAGRYFSAAADAIEHVRAAWARGARSIDVGCFQINLLHHPSAFASLEDAFDPARNAAYAAQLLARHHARSGSWDIAAGDYHSLSPAYGPAYAARVAAVWSGLSVPAPPSAPGALRLPVVWRPGSSASGVAGTPSRIPTVFIPGTAANRSAR